jgi:hypothetical protein
MGLHIRDERQMNALTGLSPAPCDPRLSVFSDLSQATPQQTYDKETEAGTRRRKPGGGGTGPWPTRADTRRCVLSYYPTYPTFEVLGTQLALARSPAQANLHQLSPIL